MHLPVFASNTDSAQKPSELLPCLLPSQTAVNDLEHSTWAATPHVPQTALCMGHSTQNWFLESLMLANDNLPHTVYCICFAISSAAHPKRELTRFWNRAAHTGNIKSLQQKSNRADKLLAPTSASLISEKKPSPERGEKTSMKARFSAFLLARRGV